MSKFGTPSRTGHPQLAIQCGGTELALRPVMNNSPRIVARLDHAMEAYLRVIKRRRQSRGTLARASARVDRAIKAALAARTLELGESVSFLS